jgi:signal peptidase I
MNKNLINKIAVCALVALLVFVYFYRQKKTEYEVFYFENEQKLALALQAKSLQTGGRPVFVLPTGSMRPTVQDYDYVIIIPPSEQPYDSIEEGDIVMYKAEWTTQDIPVLHRAVTKDRWGWIMKGDNPNNSYENKSRVTAQNYLGKLHSIYRLKTNDRSPNK